MHHGELTNAGRVFFCSDVESQNAIDLGPGGGDDGGGIGWARDDIPLSLCIWEHRQDGRQHLMI